MSLTRHNRKTAGLCYGCGKAKPAEDKDSCNDCLAKKKELATKLRTYRQTAGLCQSCGTVTDKSLCCECRQRQKKSHKQLKDLVFAAYGGYICTCPGCTETAEEFMTIDHINGGGNAHRRAENFRGREFYRWLRDNDFPAGFGVLCLNCNFSRGLHGYCPHERGYRNTR